MNFGTYTVNKDDSNRIYRESQNRNYNINYGRVNNRKYNEKSNKNKVIRDVILLGALGFFAYKKVIKPVINVVKEVVDAIKEDTESRVMREDDRIFDGRVRVLTDRELEAMRRDSSNVYILDESCYEVHDEN